MTDPQNNTKSDNISPDSEVISQNDSPESDTSEDERVEQDGNNDYEKKSIKTHIDDFFRSHMLTNVLLAGLFANSIYLFYHDYDTTHRFSSLLMMIQVCCVTLFFLIRMAPAKISMSRTDWLVAVAGTCLPLLIAPVTAENEIVALMLMQFFGIFISTIAIISLNTSFAIVPAIRKIKTGGLYSLVRHPIYFGYFLTFTCIVLQNFSLRNLIVLAALYAADIYRIKAEEKLLSIDPGYTLYKARVRYRLLPFVW